MSYFLTDRYIKGLFSMNILCKDLNESQFFTTILFICLNYFSVPTAPPENLMVGWFNESTAYAHWRPPPSSEMNGHLLGYKVSAPLVLFYTCNALLPYLSKHNTIDIKVFGRVLSRNIFKVTIVS